MKNFTVPCWSKSSAVQSNIWTFSGYCYDNISEILSEILSFLEICSTQHFGTMRSWLNMVYYYSMVETLKTKRVLRTLEISRHSAVNNPFRPATLMRIFALFCIFDNFLCEARSLAFDLHPVASFFRSVSYRAVRMPALCAEEQNVFSSFCSFRPLWSTVLPWWASFV